jgi:hypothetical protein
MLEIERHARLEKRRKDLDMVFSRLMIGVYSSTNNYIGSFTFDGWRVLIAFGSFG